MPDTTPSLDTIVCEAVEIADPAERLAYLARACGPDDALRKRAEALVAAHFGAGGSFLERPAAAVASTAAFAPGPDDPPGPAIGAVVGPYHLREQIGEGGMGLVFVAEQTEPVRRKVALKVIKPGMDSRQVIARFEAERQALALMDHPNIARVHDGGTTPDGRPFFVMELVRGIPVTDYCDQARLSVPERLALFVSVCRAVQHAHQKGVIHRDLKPSNVLVTVIDGVPVPKVIDFGIAKATGAALTDRSLYTGLHQLVGTPLYMSPEQAELSGVDVDTRSDVYSLGVLLYELLIGTTPFDKDAMRRAGLDELRRMIREDEPARPSTRLSTLQAAARSTAADRRGVDARRLTRQVRGELDWVVMKCLEKDRNRRYETASALAADVGRYLSGEPVEAHPPSKWYRLRKFARRNRGALAAVAAILAVVGGVTGLVWRQNLRLAAANADTSAALEREEKQREQAEANERKAVTQRQIAEAVKAFLQNAILQQADPANRAELRLMLGGGRPPAQNPTLREALDHAAVALAPDKIEDAFPGQPEVQAEILHTVGEVYQGVGAYDQAVAFLTRSVEAYRRLAGSDDPTTLTAQNDLAIAYGVAGQLTEAIELLERTRDARAKTLGPDHAATLVTAGNLGVAYSYAGRFPEAIELLEKTRDKSVKVLGPDDPATLAVLLGLVSAYADAGRRVEAVELAERVRDGYVKALGPDNPTTFLAVRTLGDAYRFAGRVADAIPLLERTRDGLVKVYGAAHPECLTTMNALGAAYREAGRFPEAVEILEQARDGLAKQYGSESPDTLRAANSLAVAYMKVGRSKDALALLEELRVTCEKVHGAKHPNTLSVLDNLAGSYWQAKRLPEAIALYERVRDGRVAALAPDHPDTLTTLGNLATAYRDAGRPGDAIEPLARVRQARLKTRGPDHPETLKVTNDLGVACWSARRFDLSVPLFEELLRRREGELGRDHHETLQTVANLGVNYRDAGRHHEAILLLEEAHRASTRHSSLRWVARELLTGYERAGFVAEAAALAPGVVAHARTSLPKGSAQLGAVLAVCGRAMLVAGAWTDAEPVLCECLAIREATQPDGWATFNTQSMLGGALLGQKKYAEAEPLLVNGYEGMKRREGTIPPAGKERLPEAVDRLVELYRALGKPVEGAKWQAERAKYPPELAPPPREKK